MLEPINLKPIAEFYVNNDCVSGIINNILLFKTIVD